MNIIIQTAEDLAHETAESKRSEARAYLIRTDWMILRYAETGTEVPQEVLQERANARALLNG